MVWKLIGQSSQEGQPRPATAVSTQAPRRTGPVEEWEIDPEAMEEIRCLVERAKRGEVKWTSHEELMRELELEDEDVPSD